MKAPDIRIRVIPDVTRMIGLLAIIEEHASALRASLEEFSDREP